ncbi:uncharacterized protein DUF4878 [Chitinophaga skermanii]|uniref:Uncharacterized protein DUF4878 n=1 Tax=Chitinophaga skermanii TaxID=331697 RepID=A0A327QTY3_9BACT|nr:DUF4878 domain-containing protein [Chitinophaga skermanii]RAJ06863.1 uncharacterized protein DUF4878 [Chitinophaga skermanii]
MSYYRRIVTIVCITGVVLMTGCKKHPEPNEVALNFMHAIQNSNFEAAKEYSTKESVQVITLYSIFDQRRKEGEREKIKNAKIDVVDVKINDAQDHASVTVLNSSVGKEETLQLVKESGQWKISLTLESIIPNYVPEATSDSTSVISVDSTGLQMPGTVK